MKQEPKLEVRESGIHGTGVYAAHAIHKGTFIIEYAGEKISTDEGDKRSEENPNLTYIFSINKELDIDGNVNGNESRYINHSCDPNAEIRIIGDKIEIFALKDIDEGEEITYDYEMDADNVIPCACQKTACRGYMNDPDILKKKEQ